MGLHGGGDAWLHAGSNRFWRFNYQLPGGVVVGVEGDYSLLKQRGYQEAVATEGAILAANHYLQARTAYELNWMATLRGRIGFQFDRMFVYGTAGLAYLDETQRRTQYRSVSNPAFPAGRNTLPIAEENDAVLRHGWTVGGGIEYALTNNWSLKGEYLYADFGTADFEFPGATAGVTLTRSGVPGTSTIVNGRTASNDLDLHSVKLGINYRF